MSHSSDADALGHAVGREQDRARHYRHRADEVRSLLDDVQNETIRAKLKEVADEYDALASGLEAKSLPRAS